MQPLDFVPTAVREAFDSAGSGLVGLAAAIPPDRWDEPGLGVWTVRDLVGHAGRALTTVTTYLAQGRGKTVELAHPFDYFRALGYPPVDSEQRRQDDAAVAARGRQSGAELGDDPAGRLDALRAEAVAAVAAAPNDTPVDAAAGVMRLIDYLPSRVFELVVHSGDIAAATGVPLHVDAGAATIALTIAAAIAARGDDPVEPLLALTGRRTLPAGFSVI